MNIALLSGADKNAGDFLIVQRSKQLLKYACPNSNIVEFKRNTSLEPHLDEINACDCVVFAGGPGYVPDMYPGRFPLVDNLEEIKPPMFALGMGGFTPTQNVNRITFTPSSRVLLDRIQDDGFGLGCRDRLTEQLLKANGYSKALFTGCPAWFDLDRVDMAHLLSKPTIEQIRSISISDPAIRRNLDAPKALVEELRNRIGNVQISFVFHRGWTADEHTSKSLARRQQALVSWARSNDINVVDISYGCNGFTVYDQCDLHVGYRVHAHLYCTSRRIPTFLIEEDGRGWGANDALQRSCHIGLDSPSRFGCLIEAASAKAGLPSCVINPSFQSSASKVVSYIIREVKSGYPDNERSCRVAHEVFSLMREHVGQLARLIH